MAKISVLSSDAIDKYEFFTGVGVLSTDQSRATKKLSLHIFPPTTHLKNI